MDKFTRIHQLHRIFKARRYPVKLKVLAEEMDDCTEQTAKRTINTMRDYYHAPIVYLKDKGWCYQDPDNQYELPGIWFSTKELLGLASVLKIVNEMQTDFLNDELDNISNLIDELLKKHGLSSNLFKERIRIISDQHKTLNSDALEKISVSLIEQTQLELHYKSYEGEKTKRAVSPLKLVYYQENWYLDAYCHLKDALRSFKVNRIIKVNATDIKGIKVNSKETEAHFESSYGIFSGTAKQNAVLQFYGDAARDVAMQSWHPKQESQWNNKGYLLTIPYNDDRELIQNILKHGSGVEVVEPAALKTKLTNIAKSIVGLYS